MPQREYNEKENTFLLFTEQRTAISYLTDEEAGKMFKAIYAYADEGITPEFTGSMMSVFSMYRSQIDRCKEAYRKKCEKNRENSNKRKAIQDKMAKQSKGGLQKASLSTDNDRCPLTSTDILPNPDSNPKPNPVPDIDDGVNTSIINEGEVIVEEEYPFEKIWEMYDKKVGNVAALRETWKTLSVDEKRDIFEYVPIYVRVRPDRKYRKNFENFLACRTWETEPITLNELNNGSNYRNSPQTNETRRAIAEQNTMLLASKFFGEQEEPGSSFDGVEE